MDVVKSKTRVRKLELERDTWERRILETRDFFTISPEITLDICQ